MENIRYKLEKTGDFIIEDYNRAKAFSSFFPGIAGLNGIPLWAFYVNRGQCIASFGIENKDSAMLEFLPANQAYNMTPVKGFRTFLKVKKGGRVIFYEPFRETSENARSRISTKMTINPSKLEIEERNRSLGIRINVSYITVPNESFAALARKVSITNTSGKRLDVELVDGLPHISPFGTTEWYQKHISRTIEAWITVSNMERKAPFYSLKVNPQDRPELEYIKRGNFYAAYKIDGRKVKALEPVIDPDVIFGRDGDISYPRAFVEEKGAIASKPQRREGKTPSAFSYAQFTLKSGGGANILSIIGNAADIKSVNAISKKIQGDPSYFEKRRFENEDIIQRLQNRIFTKSSSDELDFYARQTYLDNLLRGGFPVSIDTENGPFVFYAYARKHGDLERDYNAFLIKPSYYSQGNGAYRDINQNRRNDVFFNPDVADENIRTFINAIQPDGFNPHLIEGIKISVKSAKTLESRLKKHIKNSSARNKAGDFLRKPFTPGSFMSFLESEGLMARQRAGGLLKDILAIGAKEDIIRPGEGYWIDHWTYNMDLFENYLACYPEKLKELLLAENRFTFYDTYLRVAPRDEKCVYADGKVRQYGSVVEDEDKKSFIEQRHKEPHKVRTGFGNGRIYKTTLLAKLICVITNKMASLDPFGIGIEMEAGKPGWCDSLNGMPGIFGSSLCETYELKRLILFITSSLKRLGASRDKKIFLPKELADFVTGLEKLVKKRDFYYWDSSNGLKERYREKVWYGFSGKERAITAGRLEDIFDKFLLKIERGIRKGFSKKDGMTISYYINEVAGFKFIHRNGRKELSRGGFPLVRALSFRHKPLSLFLEGPVHALRVISKEEAVRLYGAIRKSGIYDKKLRMYKINEPLEGMPDDIGRSTIFTPGWLENESVWLHMEYKYLLELLKAGLYREFFSDLRDCLVAFQPPARYGRSVLENSSFIASSAYPEEGIHGTGFVARLTGTTTEFLTMWLLMCLGRQPFKSDGRDGLYFQPDPAIPAWLFTKESTASNFYFSGGSSEETRLPRNVFAFCLFGKALVVYHNPKRRDTFGERQVRPKHIVLKKSGGKTLSFKSGSVPSPYANKIREGFYDRIDINLD